MDSLKDRVGGFTEGIVIMACPVLAAVALKKVDLRSQGDAAGAVRGSVSPLAAVCLLLCSLAFLVLDAASAFTAWLPHELMFRASKLLVHLCAISQMLLAYMILLLIAMKLEASMAILVVFGPFILYCCYLSVVRSTEKSKRAAAGEDCDKCLEPLLEFAAAVTSLLFLGLEGLALEGQTGVGQDLDSRLVAPLCLAFVFCVMGSVVMLLAAVPPIDCSEAEQVSNMCAFLHASCGALTLFFAAVVLTIVFVLYGESGVPVAVVPCLGLFLLSAICLCLPGGNQSADDDQVTPSAAGAPAHQVTPSAAGALATPSAAGAPAPPAHSKKNQVTPPPASLEMTKVTFTAFLAISLPSFRGTLGGYTHVFIVCTAMSVLFGISWRFLTHFNHRAAVWTGKVARVLTYGCLGAAVLPFVFMAMQALADADDEECHIPCNRGTSAQLQLFLACFNKRARETSSYALSSVNC